MLLGYSAIQRLSFPPAFKQSASTCPVLFVGVRVYPWLKLAFQSALICVICGYAFPAFSATPTWWTTQQVLDTTKPAKDYAVVNQGQLKTIAKKAITEMNTKLPGGAGTELNALLTTWSATNATRNDYQAVNIGQVKALAKKFYDRLNAVGQTTPYPWSTATTDDKDYAAANIGQVKNAFSFAINGTTTDSDNNGLPDAWEIANFGHIGVDKNADPDKDGLTNLQEQIRGTNPNDINSKNGNIYVDITIGNDVNKGWMPTVVNDLGPKKTISSGVSATISGDTVQIAAGDYSGVVIQPGTKNINISATGIVIWRGN